MKCPECNLYEGHEEWCSVGRNWSPETDGDGCVSVLLLCVGYIAALTAIGICLIIIRLELAP